MRVIEWINIAAVVLAPLVAIQVSVFLQDRKERRQRKLHIFKTLMATRASTLAPEHVQALNMIDIEFYGQDKRSKAVLNAWKAYLDHLNAGGNATELWGQKREDLFVDLLYEMSTHLKYEFDKTYIRRTSYFPRGFGDLELDQLQMRKSLLAILKGEQYLPVWVGAPNGGGAAQSDAGAVAQNPVPELPTSPTTDAGAA